MNKNKKNFIRANIQEKILESELLEEIQTASQRWLLELAGSEFYAVRTEAMKRLNDQELLYLIAAGKAKGDSKAAADKLTSNEKLGDAVMENGDLLGYKSIHERVKDKSVYEHYAKNGNPEEQVYALCQLHDDKKLVQIAVSDTDTAICSKALGGISDEKLICYVALNGFYEKIRGYAAEMIDEQELLADIIINSKDFIICLNIMERIYDQDCLIKIALNNGKQGVYQAIRKLKDEKTLVTLIKKNIYAITAFERLCEISADWKKQFTPEIVNILIKRNRKNIFPYKDDWEILRRVYKAGHCLDILEKYQKEPLRPFMIDKGGGVNIEFAALWLFKDKI